MSYIRLFNCNEGKEYSYNEALDIEFVYTNIKQNAQIYFGITPLIDRNITVDLSDPDFIAKDDEGSLVIVLFQQPLDMNVLSKGVYYLDKLNLDPSIDKKKTKVLCISHIFQPFDVYTASLLNRNIRLVRFTLYSDNLLLFEQVYPNQHYQALHEILDLKDTANWTAQTKTSANAPNTALRVARKKTNLCGIGHCTIKNNRHYVVFPNHQAVEILDLPEYFYLAEGQFVLVDEYGSFKYAYNYIWEDNALNHIIGSFAVVKIQDNKTYIDKGNGVMHPLMKDTPIEIKDKSIVSVDKNNRFIRYYKPLKRIADSFMKSVKTKGHQMVFVTDINNEGVYIRDVETGKEYIKNIDRQNQKCKKYSVLCLNQDKIVTVFASKNFYTHSSYYNRIRYGIVDKEEEAVYVKTLDGERIRIDKPSDSLENGQIVCVDEFSQIIRCIEHPEEESGFINAQKNTGEKNDDKKDTEDDKNREEDKPQKIEIIGTALVLGNNSFANSYKLSLLKCGYLARVLEGYEPWAKIKALMKGVDIIVVVTSHVSHENMYRIKKEVTDIPVIYSEFDGANRIQLLISERLSSSPVEEEQEAL